MGSKRNKNAGHIYERAMAIKLRELGYFDVRCSREVSRLRDNKKVDLCNADEDENGRLPFNFQCKSYTGGVNYRKLLLELEEHNKNKQHNIILNRYTLKKNKKFMCVGNYSIMRDFDYLKVFHPGITTKFKTVVTSRTSCIDYHKIMSEGYDEVHHIIVQGEKIIESYIISKIELLWDAIKVKKNEK